jgi:hypothetical protein
MCYHQPVAFPKCSLITNTHIYPLPFASSNLRLCVLKDRLSRLEASVASNRGKPKAHHLKYVLAKNQISCFTNKTRKLLDAGSEEHLKTISELQAKLEGANAELASEREKVTHIFILLVFLLK